MLVVPAAVAVAAGDGMGRDDSDNDEICSSNSCNGFWSVVMIATLEFCLSG